MTEIDNILEKVRTHYALLPSDKTGLEPWDELTVKEASKALQDLILREKMAELEDVKRWQNNVKSDLASLIEVDLDELIDDRLKELQNQLKAKP